MKKLMTRYPAIVVAIPVGALMAAGVLISGASALQAAMSMAIVIGYAMVVTTIGRRSETASALAGRPVDERWEHIDLEACAYALGISTIVVLAAFVVTQASGGAWQPYALIAAVLGLSYVGSVVVLRAAH